MLYPIYRNQHKTWLLINVQFGLDDAVGQHQSGTPGPAQSSPDHIGAVDGPRRRAGDRERGLGVPGVAAGEVEGERGGIPVIVHRCLFLGE